ncbi:MAG: hypothetical protein ABI760_08895 [Ferruginibacter sp.]
MEKLRAGINEFNHYQGLLQIKNWYDTGDVIYMVIKAVAPRGVKEKGLWIKVILSFAKYCKQKKEHKFAT